MCIFNLLLGSYGNSPANICNWYSSRKKFWWSDGNVGWTGIIWGRGQAVEAHKSIHYLIGVTYPTILKYLFFCNFVTFIFFFCEKICLLLYIVILLLTTHNMFNGRPIIRIFFSIQTHSTLFPQFSSKRQFYGTYSIKP